MPTVDICRRICQQSGGHCIGCGRTPTEIKRWRNLDDSQRTFIARMAERRIQRDAAAMQQPHEETA